MPRPRTAKPRSPDHDALGRAISVLMAENPLLSLDIVGRDSGLDEKQIGTYIRGQGNPTFSTLVKLADGLHVKLSTLLEEAERLKGNSHGP